MDPDETHEHWDGLLPAQQALELAADGPTDCRGEPLDLGPGPATRRYLDYEAEQAIARMGPATSADLLDLDAVPEPVDSAEPAATYLPGCAPIGPTAETRPYRRPESEDDELMHARTLARARL